MNIKMTDFNHNTMCMYQKYLLKTQENEKQRQKIKRFCDGSMQQYLEEKWTKEGCEVKQMISSNHDTRSSMDIFHKHIDFLQKN